MSTSAAAMHRWWLPLSVLLLGLVLAVGGEPVRLALRFDRIGLHSGEFWRLLSGHFVHLGGTHFALNAAGLGLVWYLVGESFDWRRWLLIGAVCVLSIDVGLWFLKPGLTWYVGLSGLLHGILAAGLAQQLRRPNTEMLVLATLLVAKLLWEQLGGPLPGSEAAAGGAVVVDAHLFGALGGAVCAIALQIRARAPAAI